MITSEKKKTRRKFTPEFKLQAVKRVLAGHPVAAVARELGIGESLLHNLSLIHIYGAWGVKRVRRNLALGVRNDRLAGAREVGDEGKRSIGQSEEVRFDGVFVPSPVLGGVVDYQDGAVAAAVAVKQRDAFRLFGAGAGGNVENGR